MPSIDKRPPAPLVMANEVEHRRKIAERANAGLPTDGSFPMVRPLPLATYTQSTLPSASEWGAGIAYLSDIETLAISDGADWKYVSTADFDKLPFGAVHTEQMTPVFQSDAVYSINPLFVDATTGRAIAGSGTGTATVSNNYYTCTTGTTSYSFGTIQSRRRLRYRAGQGVVALFSGIFNSGVASSVQVIGCGTAEAGFYFGFNGTSFGILHVTGGVREVHTLTITTASTATDDYVVTLPNSSTVNVTATNNGSTSATAYEISQGTFPGWQAEAVGSTVIFINGSAGPVTGTFSLAQTGAGTPAAGTDAETLAGVASTDTWVAQSSWNGDTLDGTGASGVTIDPTKANVYRIGMEYLGAGAVTFEVEIAKAGKKPYFQVVHTLLFPNTRTTTTVSQPCFPFTMAAYSAGSTTDISVKCSSFSGFIVGQQSLLGPRMTYVGSATSSTSAYVPLFTVRNTRYYKGRANQCVVKLISVGGAAKSANGLTGIYLIRNATLSAGTPSFSQYDSGSPTYVDTGATACTIANNNQIQFVGYIAESGNFNFGFLDREISIQPGESMTLAVKSVSATATVAASLNTAEDQ